ncbi:histidine phosphatase family protein [Streptomyces sp. NPDC047987]|uniref:SixA phosphatase family protein n=1 Tax=unclassified Streptomyces TaxID=2593676 RepID=UPI003416C441
MAEVTGVGNAASASGIGAIDEGAGGRLIVLRHAKSAWPDGVADHERPLAGRGRRDAPAAGRRLFDTGCVPDLVVCSTARRARETWHLVATEMAPAEPDVVFEPRVYAASASGLLRVLRDLAVLRRDAVSREVVVGGGPERCRTVLLVGHQPAVQELVLTLTGGGDEQALERVRIKFPTSAFAVLTVPGTRAGGGLAPGTAVLTDFAVPRGPVPDARG